MDETLLVGGTTVLLRSTGAGVQTLLMRRPERGSFAGAWVFPGGVTEETDAEGAVTEVQTAERAAARECEEEVGVRPEHLTALSCWVPPVEAPKRVRTWFFLAQAPDAVVHAAPDEVVDVQWIAPADALRRHADGDMVLYPPTWITLRRLAARSSVDDAVAAASAPEHYTTVLLGGGVFVWEGDSEHPAGGAGRHRLDTSSLPWIYTRD